MSLLPLAISLQVRTQWRSLREAARLSDLYPQIQYDYYYYYYYYYILLVRRVRRRYPFVLLR